MKRIVQLIDSLEIGGAERMAINYANALLKETGFSGLVATRKEGGLKNQIDPGVAYLSLQRKKTLDFNAAFRLKKFCKTHRVNYLQPHSSSYFTALMVKMIYPKITIIWHDHNGLSEFLSSRKSIALKMGSLFFKGIVVVNYQLKNWAERELYCKHVIYLPNFTKFQEQVNPETVLKGTTGKRILCLANLRDQKNHFLLLRVASLLKTSHSSWTFHLVGKDFNDTYSEKLSQAIIENNLQEHVYLYGSRTDSGAIINQSDIAIMTSKSEGLPVALLEYGLYKKPVVVTNVGELPLIVKNAENGFIVPTEDEKSFHKALVNLIEDETLRIALGEALFQTISENNTEKAIIKQYMNWLATL